MKLIFGDGPFFSGAGEMAQKLNALVKIPEDQGLLPRSHSRWLTTTRNSGYR